MSKNTNSSFDMPDDWRGKMMGKVRKAIQEAAPEATEDVKWKTASNPNGVLVWYKDGMILTGEIYKKHLRLSFAKGPELKKNDPKKLINSYRAIILKEEDKLNKKAFKALIHDAIKLNEKSKK